MESNNRSFLTANVGELVEQMTPQEKMLLLGAPNWWNTNAIPRLGIPSIRMSDGPNGVRGSSHFIATPAQCLPCATAMASTFDPDLVHKIGELLADEAKVKSSVVLLAPTCNVQRNPLGGRSFESFSEDPYLSGTLSAAYVNGLQSKGVSATIKHFVANDQESERTAANSVMTDRALREIYLYPFMLAQRLAKPRAYMTSYGRIKGVHCAENPFLLQKILREEWGFEGIVMSDWFGTYSVEDALNAGLDLEMPGPPRWRTPLLISQSIASQKLLPSAIDTRLECLLRWIQKQTRSNPEVVYGDGVERSKDSPEAREFCRKIAAEGVVLLKNEGSLLPLQGTKKILVIGPNAKGAVISGGGSAALKPTYVVSPYDGIVQGAGKDADVSYAIGCHAHKYLPTLENSLTAPDGQPGWLCTFYNLDSQGNKVTRVAEFVLRDTRVRLNDHLPDGLVEPWGIELTGTLAISRSGEFEFGLAVSGRARLYVDEKLTVDNWEDQTPGEFFYGQGTVEEKGTITAVEGRSVELRVEYSREPGFNYIGSRKNGGSFQPALMRGVRLGGVEKIDEKSAIDEAVSLASQADVVVIIAGLTPEWESEGFDRDSLHLPGQQDDLIQRVGKANSNTVVVLQTGSAVAMPWLPTVSAVLQSWYLGNESGNGIADVLLGKVNPSARLPLTLPAKKEDIAAYPQLMCENGYIFYGEDLYVGYRHFVAKKVEPLFPFGFGLSYTTFSFSNLSIKEVSSGSADELRLEVSVSVKNTGSKTGSQVAQLYIDLPDSGFSTPKRQLKSFIKVHDIAPGEERTGAMMLDKYAVSSWDPRRNLWAAQEGVYRIHVGGNCFDLPLAANYELKRGFSWTGL